MAFHCRIKAEFFCCKLRKFTFIFWVIEKEEKHNKMKRKAILLMGFRHSGSSWMDGGWIDGIIFLLFYLHTYMLYSSCIVVYPKVYNFLQDKILMGFKILSSWGLGYTNSKCTKRTTIFIFSSKT